MYSLRGREARFRTDFNSVRDDGLITAVRGFGGTDVPVSHGDVITLFDGDGNTCRARVVRGSDELILASPDWATWQPAVELDLNEALRETLRAVRDGAETRGYPEPQFFEITS